MEAPDGEERLLFAAWVGERANYASVGWTCGDHVWFIDSVWGTVDELTTWAIAADDCAS